MIRRWRKDLALWASVVFLTMPACTCQQRQEALPSPAEPRWGAVAAPVTASRSGWSTRAEPALDPNVQPVVPADESAVDLFAQKQAAVAIARGKNDGTEGDVSPSVSIGADVDDGGAPLTVHFTSLIDPLPRGTHVLWDFGDGGGARDDPSPTHTYRTPGDYNATLRADWPGGSGEDSASISVDEEAFDVEIEAEPESGEAPLRVRFQASADTDVPASRLRFEWDLGGGVKGAGPTTEHVYMNPGSYPVTVVVTNLAGQHGQAQTEIDVENAND